MPLKNTVEIILKATDHASDVLRRMGAVSEQQMNRIKKDAETASRSFDYLKTAVVGFLGIMAGRAARSWLIDTNIQMEQAEIGFSTMLGSAEKAKSFLDDLEKFAAKTPFEFTELRTAATRMLAFGFSMEQVLPTLTAIGNAAAGLGMGAEGVNRIILALGQMRAKAKVSAQEMMQLTEAGIPAWDILAKAMGKSTAEVMKLAEKGVIPADKAIQALTEGMSARFPNMMAAQSKTLGGMISNLQDWSEKAGRTLGKGLFEQIKPMVENALKHLNKLADTGQLEKWGAQIGKSFAFVVEHGRQLTAVLVGLGTAFTIHKSISMAAVALETFRASTFAATLATRGLTAALMMNPLGLVAAGAGLAAGAYMMYRIRANEAADATNALTEETKNLIDKYNQAKTVVENAAVSDTKKAEAQELLNNVTRDMENILPELLRAYGQEKLAIDISTGSITDNTRAMLANLAVKKSTAFAEIERTRMEMARISTGVVPLEFVPFLDERKLSVAEKASGQISSKHQAIQESLKAQNATLSEAEKHYNRISTVYDKAVEAVEKAGKATLKNTSATVNWGEVASKSVGKVASKTDEALRKELTALDNKVKSGKLTEEQQLTELERLEKLAKTEEGRIAVLEKIASVKESIYRRIDLWINHEVAMNSMSVDSQIAAYERLRRKHEWSVSQKWELEEKLARLYGNKLKAVAEDIEKTYQNQVDTINRAAEETINNIQSKIDELDARLKAIDEEKDQDEREDTREAHEKRLGDLYEQRLYHEQRTGREHAKAIANIDKQIAEENKSWAEKQEDWQRDDRRKQIEAEKEAYQEQIEQVKNTAEEKKKELKNYYDEVKKITDKGLLDTIASMAAKNNGFLKKGYDIIDAIKKGMESADLAGYLAGLQQQIDVFQQTSGTSAKGTVTSGAGEAGKAPTATITSGQYVMIGGSAAMPAKTLASLLNESITWDATKKQVIIGGKTFAPLQIMSGSAYVGIREVASALGHDVKRDESSKNIMIYHEGGPVLSDTLALLQKGEYVIPRETAKTLPVAPDLSTIINQAADRIIAAINQRMFMKIDKLLHIEHYEPEDELDVNGLTRQLKSAVLSLVRAGG